ncbi:MAG: hypothetical protein HZA15_05265 [Nitrospirae bacterium]|nr:hypothetical protein [Nitrospirota bacterium]
MQYPNKRIEDHVSKFSAYSDESLEIIKQQNNAWGDLHIAAKLVLDSRKKKEEDNKHRETIKESRKTNRLTIWTFIIASLLALFFFLADHFLLTRKNNETKNISTTNKESQKITPINAVPNQAGQPSTLGKQQIKKQIAK